METPLAVEFDGNRVAPEVLWKNAEMTLSLFRGSVKCPTAVNTGPVGVGLLAKAPGPVTYTVTDSPSWRASSLPQLNLQQFADFF